MVGTEDLQRIVREIEDRLHRVVTEDLTPSRLTRDLSRARLYLTAASRGYVDLIPHRLSRDLLHRYTPGNNNGGVDVDEPPVGSGDASDSGISPESAAQN